MNEKRYHWHYITLVKISGSFEKQITSFYAKFDNANITRTELCSEMEKNDFVPNQSAMINNMYLGYMTEKEFFENF